MRSNYLFVGCAAFMILCAWIGGCRTVSYTSDRSETKRSMVQLCFEISLMNDGNAPISDANALGDWVDARLAARRAETRSRVTVEVVRSDKWGRPLHVLSLDGKIWGLASDGANGTWENGGADDIVVLIGPGHANAHEVKWSAPENE